MAERAFRVAVLGNLFDDDPAGDRNRLEAAGVTVVAGRGGSEDEIIATCAGADAVMASGGFPFGERVFASLEALQFLQQCSVGYDRVDVGAATRHGVMVANSPTFCSEEVSDHAAMLILACARNLPHQISAAASHGWSRPAALDAMGPTRRLRGRTLGFVGFGRIARITAEKLSGFGMRYLAHDPYVTQDQVGRWRVEMVSLDALCRQADVVTMHALLNDGSRRMFGEAQFRAMKPTACFVNTSRGGTVDEPAMIRALRERWIAGAGLDVLEKEPPVGDNPLLGMPHVLLTPHTAGYSLDSLSDNRRDTVNEVLRVRGGHWPQGLVNPEVKASARFRPTA